MQLQSQDSKSSSAAELRIVRKSQQQNTSALDSNCPTEILLSIPVTVLENTFIKDIPKGK